MVSHTGRLGRAALATGLALVLLTGAGGTRALWSDTVELEPGSLRAGNVQLTQESSRVELHSKQPVGSRTYASTQSCQLEAGDTECKVITGTIADEALIPGDRIVITEKVVLAASGENLKGTFTVSTSALTRAGLSAFSGSATTATQVTPPGGNPVSATSFPVVVGTSQGIGTYTIRTTITTPTKNGSADWGAALREQQLYEGTYTSTFTQTS